VTTDNAAGGDVDDLIREMEIMKLIGQHPNIRGLAGCCTQDGQFYLLIKLLIYLLHSYILGKILTSVDWLAAAPRTVS